MWSDVNPHNTIQSRYQQEFSINIWAGTAGDCFWGPYILPHRLNGAAYWHISECTLPELLDTLLLDIWWNISFRHDGGQAHFSYTARDYLGTGWWMGAEASILAKSFTRHVPPRFFPLETSKIFGAHSSSGKFTGTAAVRWKWLYLSPQHSWNFSMHLLIHALLGQTAVAMHGQYSEHLL